MTSVLTFDDKSLLLQGRDDFPTRASSQSRHNAVPIQS